MVNTGSKLSSTPVPPAGVVYSEMWMHNPHNLMAHKSKITPGKTENQLGMYFNTSAFKGKFLLASKG